MMLPREAPGENVSGEGYVGGGGAGGCPRRENISGGERLQRLRFPTGFRHFPGILSLSKPPFCCVRACVSPFVMRTPSHLRGTRLTTVWPQLINHICGDLFPDKPTLTGARAEDQNIPF